MNTTKMNAETKEVKKTPKLSGDARRRKNRDKKRKPQPVAPPVHPKKAEQEKKMRDEKQRLRQMKRKAEEASSGTSYDTVRTFESICHPASRTNNSFNREVKLSLNGYNLGTFISSVVEAGMAGSVTTADGDTYQQLFNYFKSAMTSYPQTGYYPKIILQVAAALQTKRYRGISYVTDLTNITNCTTTAWAAGSLGNSGNWYTSSGTPYYATGTVNTSFTLATVTKLLMQRSAEFGCIDAAIYNHDKNPYFKDVSAFAWAVATTSQSANEYVWKTSDGTYPIEGVFAHECPITQKWIAPLRLFSSGTANTFRFPGRADDGCLLQASTSPGAIVYCRLRVKENLKDLCLNVDYRAVHIGNVLQRFVNFIEAGYNLFNTGSFTLTSLSKVDICYVLLSILGNFFQEYAAMYNGLDWQATYYGWQVGIASPLPQWAAGLRIPKYLCDNLNFLLPRVIDGRLVVPIPTVPGTDPITYAAFTLTWTGSNSWTMVSMASAGQFTALLGATSINNYQQVLNYLSAGHVFADYKRDYTQSNIDVIFEYGDNAGVLSAIGSMIHRGPNVLKNLVQSFEMPFNYGGLGDKGVRYNLKYYVTLGEPASTQQYVGKINTQTTMSMAAGEYFVQKSVEASNIRSYFEEIPGPAAALTWDTGGNRYGVTTSGDHGDILDRARKVDKPKYAAHHFPEAITKLAGITYGNYGGPNHGDPKFEVPPVDDLDKLFMIHDAEYVLAGGPEDVRKADANLVKNLESLNNRGTFGEAARWYFKFKDTFRVKHDEEL